MLYNYKTFNDNNHNVLKSRVQCSAQQSPCVTPGAAPEDRRHRQQESGSGESCDICCNSINEFRQRHLTEKLLKTEFISTMGSISDGIDNLCLDDDVDLSSVSVNTFLGAIPKVNPVTTKHSTPPTESATPQTPTASKKQQRKKNRKDRRRSDIDSGRDSAGEKPSQPMSKVERLRLATGGGVQRSNSDRKAAPVNPDVSSLLFKSNSSISVNTGIKNLPESFFSDRLPEEIEEDEIREKSEKDQKKRKRRKQKRKQTSTEEEEDRTVSEKENIAEDILNDKLIDDDPGEEIITHFGDEQCVVSHRAIQHLFCYFDHINLVQLEKFNTEWRHQEVHPC